MWLLIPKRNIMKPNTPAIGTIKQPRPRGEEAKEELVEVLLVRREQARALACIQGA